MKNRAFFAKLLLALLTVVAVSACSSDDVVTAEQKTIKLNAAQMNLVFGADEYSYIYITYLPTDVNPQEIIWVNSNPSVVSFDAATGKVQALSEGTSTITAKAKNGTIVTSCHVSVNHVKVTDITISQNSLVLTYTSEESAPSADLTASVNEEAYNKSIVWTSSDTTVVKVDETGHVTVVDPLTTDADGNVIPDNSMPTRTAVITAKSVDQSLTASCNVTVAYRKASSLTLNKTELTLSEGETTTLISAILPSDVCNTDVKWTSSNVTVCKVAADKEQSSVCTLTAVKGGKVTITATSADGAAVAKCEVTVKSREGIIYTPYEPGKNW